MGAGRVFRRLWWLCCWRAAKGARLSRARATSTPSHVAGLSPAVPPSSPANDKLQKQAFLLAQIILAVEAGRRRRNKLHTRVHKLLPLCWGSDNKQQRGAVDGSELRHFGPQLRCAACTDGLRVGWTELTTTNRAPAFNCTCCWHHHRDRVGLLPVQSEVEN